MATNYTGFDVEDNPFDVIPPEDIRRDSPALHEYLTELAAKLRDAYTAQQFEVRSIDESELELLHSTEVYALGTLTQFNHTVYGMMTARFVKFASMTSSSAELGPVGASNGLWEVTNAWSQARANLISGIIGSIEEPVSGQYGWIIVSGVNVNPIQIEAGETVEFGAGLSWNSTGKLSIDVGNRVIARYVGSSNDTGTLAAGTVIIEIESTSSANAIEALQAVDATLSGRIDDNEGAIVLIQNTLVLSTEYDAAIADIENDIVSLTSGLNAEINSRANADATLSGLISTLEIDLTADITATVAAEASARSTADTNIISLLDSQIATHVANITAIDGVTAALDSRVVALELTGSYVIGVDVQAWSAELDLATQGIFGEPGLEGSGVTIHGVNYDASLKVSDIGNSHPAEFIMHRHSLTLPNALVSARSHSNDETHSIVLDNDILFGIYATGHDGADYEMAGSITVEVDGTPGSDDMPGRIVWSTTPNGSYVPVYAGHFDSSQLFKLANPLEVTEGGSGASTASGARNNFGLGTIATFDGNQNLGTGDGPSFAGGIFTAALNIDMAAFPALNFKKSGVREADIFVDSGNNLVFRTNDITAFVIDDATQDIIASSKIITSDITDSTSTTTGSAVSAGGIGVAKRLFLGGHLVMNKASTGGIKVDTTTPTFGWADLLGDQFSKNTGATKPTLVTYNGAINCWEFVVGDEAYITYHIPHDYVKGTEIFLHIHWSHNSTTVTGGSVTFKATSIYSKGHDQAAFQSTPAVGTFVGNASTTQYQQIITETSYSDSSPTGIKLDTDLLEPDGVIELTLELDANNITSSAAVPDPFIHFIDVHYQTTGLIGTKGKAPDFYN